MMRKAFLFGLTALIAAVMALAGCGSEPQTGAESTSAKEAAKVDIKWDNDSAGFLTVNNNVDEPLVLFAGTITNQHILGGVRALASRRVDFFNQVEDSSGTFLLRAVKETVYRSKGSSLNSDDIIFAGLVTYDKSAARAIQVNINQVLGGEAYVIIQNDTNMALQIRIDRPDGPTLTTLAPFERGKKVYMELAPDCYIFFPVYIYYDRTARDIRHITAQSLADGIHMVPVIPMSGWDTPIISFAAPTYPSDLFSIQLVNERD